MPVQLRQIVLLIAVSLSFLFVGAIAFGVIS